MKYYLVLYILYVFKRVVTQSSFLEVIASYTRIEFLAKLSESNTMIMIIMCETTKHFTSIECL